MTPVDLVNLSAFIHAVFITFAECLLIRANTCSSTNLISSLILFFGNLLFRFILNSFNPQFPSRLNQYIYIKIVI